MVFLDYRDSRPIYEQIRDTYRKQILAGVLAPNAKMPSVRELAAQLAINPNTIQRAYRELEAQGYIISIPGKGSFVCTPPDAAAARKDELLARFDEITHELLLLGLPAHELHERIERSSDD